MLVSEIVHLTSTLSGQLYMLSLDDPLLQSAKTISLTATSNGCHHHSGAAKLCAGRKLGWILLDLTRIINIPFLSF